MRLYTDIFLSEYKWTKNKVVPVYKLEISSLTNVQGAIHNGWCPFQSKDKSVLPSSK